LTTVETLLRFDHNLEHPMTSIEHTSAVVAALAAKLMKHHDPEVRTLAASCLTQAPDRTATADPLLAAAKALRAAQRDYMVTNGDAERIVLGAAGSALDRAIAAAEGA
jgi:hypothetical protein